MNDLLLNKRNRLNITKRGDLRLNFFVCVIKVNTLKYKTGYFDNYFMDIRFYL